MGEDVRDSVASARPFVRKTDLEYGYLFNIIINEMDVLCNPEFLVRANA
jgi:hypothetical protein